MEASRTLPGVASGYLTRIARAHTTPTRFLFAFIFVIFTGLVLMGGPFPTPACAGGPLTGVKFVVDPGHGGSDPGAVGKAGLREKDVNLRVGLALRDLLVQYGGATVFLTRADDTFVALDDRAAQANVLGANIFISVHHNASENQNANGTETYSRVGSDPVTLHLRDSVHKELLWFTMLPDRGQHEANFRVLAKTTMPAILTEASFISNPYQEARLRQSEYTFREALAIYKGVLLHFDRSDLLVTPPGNLKLRDALSFPLPAW